MIGVMAQRLVRTSARTARCRRRSTTQVSARLVAPWKAKPPATVNAVNGCLECRNTGSSARQGIYEILRVDTGGAARGARGCDSEELRLIGMRAGMKTLRLAGARKIAAGLTTLEEVLRVAPMDSSRDGA